MIKETRVQVPLEITIKEALDLKALKLGFDSAQAYLRVIIKALVEDRKIYFEQPALGEAARMAIHIIYEMLYNHLQSQFRGTAPVFNSADEVLDFICDRHRFAKSTMFHQAWIEETAGDQSWIDDPELQ